MTTKRVIAFYMHETELLLADKAMPNGETTQSYVAGELDTEGIDALRNQGLVVQVIHEEARSEWATKVVERRTNKGLSATRAMSEPPDSFDVAAAAPRVFVLTFDRPLLPSVKKQLEAASVELIEAVAQNQYTARLTIAQKGQVDGMLFVSSTAVYDQEMVEPETLSVEAASTPLESTTPNIATYELKLHRAEDGGQVVQRLSARGITVEGHQGRKIRFHLERDSDLLPQIRGLPEVYSVDPWIKPRLHNNRARLLLGIDDPGGGALTSVITQTGNGQIVAIADSGIDQSHPDFPSGRIVGVVARGRPPSDATDPHGHGTHVAGSVLGEGTASSGKIRGAAPEAQLFFQSIMDSAGDLGGLPWDLNDLFNEAYLSGARIHNNSWGADSDSRYTFNSIEADEFVAAHPDMLIVISAGNEGTARAPVNASTGYVDWLSVNSPATSKNALTVGASQTDRTSGGYAALTWRDNWPTKFPDNPVAKERISGNPESMAAFSSRGPCDDSRVKPDLVAPGTDIVSAKASTAPLTNFWGAYPGHGGRYGYMGGTSMAAPLVSGCAALVREYYSKVHGHAASAALGKATLINGTRALTGGFAQADHPHLPNYHQGFGCLHMPWVLPNASAPYMQLAFVDSFTSDPSPLQGTGDAIRYAINVDDRHSFRVCLAWTDLPARALQNNLNLLVEDPSGRKWVGNQDRKVLFQSPDPDNNVEIVRIESPSPGDYVIKISATNLLPGVSSQHFSLVVTGDLLSALTIW